MVNLNWKNTRERAQADVQFCKTNRFVWCEPKSAGKKSKCGSIRSQPLLAPSKRVVLSALCMSVFYFYLYVFIIQIFPALRIFLDGSHWVMGCSPPGKFTSFIIGYIAMWLHCCLWVMNEIRGFFFLACLNSLELCSSDNKAASDQAAITSCQPGWIVKAAGKSCSDTRGHLKV